MPCSASASFLWGGSCQCLSQHPLHSSRAGGAARSAPGVAAHYPHTKRCRPQRPWGSSSLPPCQKKRRAGSACAGRSPYARRSPCKGGQPRRKKNNTEEALHRVCIQRPTAMRATSCACCAGWAGDSDALGGGSCSLCRQRFLQPRRLRLLRRLRHWLVGRDAGQAQLLCCRLRRPCRLRHPLRQLLPGLSGHRETHRAARGSVRWALALKNCALSPSLQATRPYMARKGSSRAAR